MIYILLVLTAGLCAVTIAAAVSGRAGQRRLSEQMRLVIQSQHASLSQAQTSDNKIDWVRYEQQQSKEMQEHHFHEHSKALDHQRKSMEHQRVMLASLNRQIQDLDQKFETPVSTKPEAGSSTNDSGQAQTSLRPHPAAIRKSRDVGQPVALSQLFNRAQRTENGPNVASGNSQRDVPERRGALIKNRDAAALGLRRVANG